MVLVVATIFDIYLRRSKRRSYGNDHCAQEKNPIQQTIMRQTEESKKVPMDDNAISINVVSNGVVRSANEVVGTGQENKGYTQSEEPTTEVVLQIQANSCAPGHKKDCLQGSNEEQEKTVRKGDIEEPSQYPSE